MSAFHGWVYVLKRRMKNCQPFVLAAVIAAVSFISPLGNRPTFIASAHAAPTPDPPIALAAARTVSTMSGTQVTRTFSGSIEVANLAYGKTVAVHYSLDRAAWTDAPAVYEGADTAGREIWTFSVALPTLTVADGDRPVSSSIVFAVNTTQAGRTYWDNNDLADYRVGTAGTGPHPETLVLGKVSVRLNGARGFVNGWPAYANSGFVNVIVKNLAYSKSVVARTTTDGWKTSYDVPLSYQETRSDGSELWTTNYDIALDVAAQDFAIKYEVDGQVFWDNNEGRNYHLTIPDTLYEDPTY